MKIVDMRKGRMTKFDSLDIGVVFIEHADGDEYVQIKTQEFKGTNGSIFNAVSLSTGEPYYIEPDVMVEMVNVELRIV